MRPRAACPPPRRAAHIVAWLGAALLLASSSHALSPGMWTPKVDWSDTTQLRTAIHMLLLRGDGDPYHSRVLWFGGEPGVFKGGLWGWKTGNDGCASYPTASFDSLASPSVGYNVFM